jgi:membrane peptidoglycan carboxypeptidase
MVRHLRTLGRALAPRLRGMGREAGERVRPIVPAVTPKLNRAGDLGPRLLAGVVPVTTRMADAIRHQVEAGRDARATPRELRDVRGRRLRASAYIFGPEGSRDPRRRARRQPGVAGSLLPVGVKVALVVVLTGFAFLGSSSAYINYAADLPDAHTITAQPLDEDSLIYSADGTLLADIHMPGLQHYYEQMDQMGKWLPEATVAVEDANFWDEPGIDVFGIARAAWVDWRQKQAVQGASTITQQLVKLRLGIGNAPTIERKVKEAVLAVQVEHTYSKQKILEQYLNAVPYSNNSQGSLAASRIYFHKDTKDLSLAQASMLAGIPQSPYYNAPLSHWDQARKRQLQVLQAMVRKKLITQEQADEAYAQDLTPPAHMFTAQDQVLAPGFVRWVVDGLVGKYGDKVTYAGGLRVHTTLNLALQHQAEQAVVDGVNANRGRGVNQGAMTAIDPRTGAVLAMVGSADPSQHGGQFNLAVTPRSPGSSMKIYTYSAAIESGKYTMVTPVPDTPLSIRLPPGAVPNPYQPRNYDTRYHGTCQLQQCMGNSYNVPAVKVELTLGLDKVVDMARRMGAPPFGPNGANDEPVTNYSSYGLTLGVYYETTLQMATGAATLGAQGTMHPPFGVDAIQASDGSEIFKADPSKDARQAMDPRVAFIMEQIMSDNDNRVAAFGANSPLILPGRRIAAKTGTSESFQDGWTVGYTPSLASAFWFGDPQSRLLTPGSDGVFIAAPSWHQFMQSALDTLQAPAGEWFSEPGGLAHATVNGKPVWLMPGTSPGQPMPPLPSFASSGPVPTPSPKPNQNGGNGNGG